MDQAAVSSAPMQEFLGEAAEILERVSQLLSTVDLGTVSSDQVDGLYRDVHTLKGGAQLFGFQSVGLLAHVLEASLEPVRQGRLSIIPTFVDLAFQALDLMNEILKDPTGRKDEDPKTAQLMRSISARVISYITQEFGDSLPAKEERTVDLVVLPKHQPPPPHPVETIPVSIAESRPKVEPIVDSPIHAQSSAPVESVPTAKIPPATIRAEPEPSPNMSHPAASTGEGNTIRVSINLLDKMMNLAGEMVLVRNQIIQYSKKVEDNDYQALSQRLDVVTSDLQDQVMRLRMQPIGSVFSKFQRLVRDIGRDLEKKIDLKIVGAETELDKSLIEAVKDPLTHIIRNSCDHAIESPSERLKSGKAEMGTIHLKALQEGGQVVIEVTDDGRGIDPNRVKQKAVEKRVVTAEAADKLSPQQIQELIFAPGFSTAEKVSSVSGRGVGMDVVKTNVEKVGGVVALKSTPGAGTTLQLRIPLTLAIVPAMIVAVDGVPYTIPQVKVQELVRVDQEDPQGIQMDYLEGAPILRLRGHLLPLISLGNLLGVHQYDFSSKVHNVVVVHTDGGPYGLIVDQILDTVDIVVKPLANQLKRLSVFSGATILGDGQVALILDPQGVAQQAGVVRGMSLANQDNQDSSGKNGFVATTEYLIVHLESEGVYGIPLGMVQRLEEFPKEAIQKSGSQRLLPYRGGLLPVVSLAESVGLLPVVNTTTSGHGPDLGRIAVVVVSKRNKLFGLQVASIQDLVSLQSEISPMINGLPGVLGTLTDESNRVVTVIDAFSVVDRLLGGTTNFSRPKENSLNGKNILLLEDTNFFARQISKVLEAAGATVTLAVDGEEGMATLRSMLEKKSLPSIIVSDIEMPRMNGFDFATHAKILTPNVPLVALTTRFTVADQRRGKEVGFDRYLEKLKADELVEALAELVSTRKETV